MFSKLRCLNRLAAAISSSCRGKTYLDKTGIEVLDTYHVIGRCFSCQDYQDQGDIHCESDGAHLNCWNINTRSSRQFRAGLFGEDTNYHIKHGISPVKHSQLRRSNLDQRTQGSVSELERGLLRLSKSQHVNNIAQSYCFSTTSARSVLAPSTVFRGTDKDEGSSWISRTQTAISGKEEAEKSSFMEDPVKNRNDQENPLIMINGNARPVIETDGVVADDESLSLLLRGCDTIEEVMTLMEPMIERKELNIDQYLEVLRRLKIIKYSSLQQYASWRGEESEEMIARMFIMMLLNNSILSEFGSLGKSSSFRRLQDNLVQLLPEMTASQYTSCFSSFVWLGVDHTSSTYVSFISHLDDIPSEDFTISTLHILSDCLHRLPRPDLSMIKYIYPRLKALMEDDCVIAADRETSFSLIYLGHIGIPDIDIGIWLSQKILKIAETTDILKNSFSASWAIRFCYDMMKLIFETNPTPFFLNNAFVPKGHSEKVLQLKSIIKDLKDLVIVCLMDLHDNLIASDVARVANSALRLGIYHLPWADMIKQRSLELFFDETLSIAQRLQVLIGLRYLDMDHETHEKIERMILTMLKDADVYSLCCVLKYLSHEKVHNPDLIALCGDKIVQTIDQIIEYSNLSRRLFPFLAKYAIAMQDEDKHLFLQTKLLALENNFHSELIWKYIINQKTWLDSSAKLLARITKYVSWCTVRQYMTILSKGAENHCWKNFKYRLRIQGRWKGETLEAVRSFENVVAKRYYSIIETNDEFDLVLNLSHRITSINPRIVCLKTLMRSVETTSEKMLLNSDDVRRLVTVLSLILIPQGYVSSRVVNRIIDSFDQSADVVEREKYMERLLRFTSIWISSESEEVTSPLKNKIQDLVQRKMDLLTVKRNLESNVYIIESLCCLEIFPEAALVDLLKMDTMARLDRIIAKSDPTSVRIQDALVTINRCMVIDKKDMKIHWFMERYTKEQRKRQSTKDIFKDRQLLEYKTIYQILGEGNFFQNWKAGCGYILSFVCLLDKNNNLLPFKMIDFQNAKKRGLQRVAIEFRYSTHSGIDMRALALEKKHLQKLGYRVVELYEWEYHSSAWSNLMECLTYCRKKIFGQLSEELTPPKYAGWSEKLEKTDDDPHYEYEDLQLSEIMPPDYAGRVEELVETHGDYSTNEDT